MALQTGSAINRKELGALIKDPSLLIQVQNALNNAAVTLPDATNAIETQVVAAQATANAANTTANAAQAGVNSLKPIEYIVAVADPTTPNARVLTGMLGLSIDNTTPNVTQLVLDVLAALGFTPANIAGDTFTGPVVIPTLSLTGLGVYANNAAALVGGLVIDDVYQTATGELRIVV